MKGLKHFGEFKKRDGMRRGTILTHEDMQGNLLDLLDLRSDVRCQVGREYVALVQVLFASASCTDTTTLNPPIDLSKEAHKKLFKDNKEVVGVGFPELAKTSVDLNVTWSKTEGIGSLPSILFWNKVQLKSNSSTASKWIIYGQFGTGKGLKRGLQF